jgi:hypothetical protein
MARMLVRSLLDGTPIVAGVRYIHVGHTRWLDAQNELLGELAEDHDSDVLFTRGTYGTGKTHFLGTVQDRAQETGWATAHIECRRDRAELDRFETVYPRIIFKLRAKRMLEGLPDGLDSGDIDGGRWFLDCWAKRLLADAGYSESPVRRTMEVEQRLYHLLQERVMRRNLSGGLQTALCAYARAALSGNTDLTNDLVGWFRGDDRILRIPSVLMERPGQGARPSASSASARSVDLRPISRSTSLEVLRGILWVIRETGHHGLVLCIDELEEIAKLRPRKRQDQCFQALREFVDNSDGDLGLRYVCTYFAATPEMFDDEEYFPRYDALKTRIEPVGEAINWRSPLIDLDRTPLADSELRTLAQKIRAVHGIARDWNPKERVSDSVLDGVVASVCAARYQVAKPRLLCKAVITELELARQDGTRYTPPPADRVVRSAADRLLRERL